MPISLARAGGTKGRAVRSAAVRAFACRVLRAEGVARADVTVILADDATLRALNARYRGLDRTTDVLSFTYDDSGASAGRSATRAPGRVRGRALAGELYISLERVHAQAPRYRHTPGAELCRLVTHGLLHLCGHDHVRSGERRVMRAAERAAVRDALTALGRRGFEVLAGPGARRVASRRRS